MGAKAKILYDAISKDYNVGTFDEFKGKLQDPSKRKALYEGVGKEYELGSYDEFESKLGVKKKEGTTSSDQLGSAVSKAVTSSAPSTKKEQEPSTSKSELPFQYTDAGKIKPEAEKKQQEQQQPLSISDDPVRDVLHPLENQRDKVLQDNLRADNTHVNTPILIRDHQGKLVEFTHKGEQEINNLNASINNAKQSAFQNADQAKEYLTQRLNKKGGNEIDPRSVDEKDLGEIYTSLGLNDKDYAKSARNFEDATGNMTDLLAFQKYQRDRNVKSAIKGSNDLYEAGIRFAASQNPELARQLQKLSTVSPNIKQSIPQSMGGELSMEFLRSPEVEEIAASNPEFAKHIEDARNHVYNEFPEYGKREVSKKISQFLENSDDTNLLVNIKSQGDVDSHVEEMMKQGKLTPQERLIYVRDIRPKIGVLRSLGRGVGKLIPGVNAFVNDSPLKTEGVLENTEDKFLGGIHDMAKTVQDVSDKISPSSPVTEANDVNKLYKSLDNDYSAFQINPAKWYHAASANTGDMLGFVSSMVASGYTIGAVNEAIGIPKAVAGKIGNFLLFEGRQAEEALKQHPENELKQNIHTFVGTAIDVGLAEMLHTDETIDKVKATIKPQMAKIVNDFSDGKITSLAAKDALEGMMDKALKKHVPDFANFALRTAAKSAEMGGVMSTFGVLHAGLDAAMGGRNVSMGQTVNDAINSFKAGTMGSVMIAGFQSLGNPALTGKIVRHIANNPEFYRNHVEEFSKTDNHLSENKNDIIQNINMAGDIAKDVEKTSLSPAQKEKYILNSLAEKLWLKKAGETQDDLIRKSYTDKANEHKEIRKQIFEGKDQADEHKSFVSVVKPEDVKSPDVHTVAPKENKPEEKAKISVVLPSSNKKPDVAAVISHATPETQKEYEEKISSASTEEEKQAIDKEYADQLSLEAKMPKPEPTKSEQPKLTVKEKKNGFNEAGERSKQEGNPEHIANWILGNSNKGDVIKIGDFHYEVTDSRVTKNGAKEVTLVPYELDENGNKDYNYSGTKLISDRSSRGKSSASDLFESSYTDNEGNRVTEKAEYIPEEQAKSEPAKEPVKLGLKFIDNDEALSKELGGVDKVKNEKTGEIIERTRTVKTEQNKIRKQLSIIESLINCL